MPSISDLLSRATDALDGRWGLAAVPAVVALLSVYRFRPTPVDFHAGVSFGFPLPVSTGWNFLSLPASGFDPNLPFGDPVLGGATLAVTALVSAVLGAGYLGGLDRALDGDGLAFATDVRRHAVPILGFQLLVFAAGFAGIGVGLLAPPLLLLTLPLLLLGAYLLFPTPYLVVVEQVRLGPALRRSVALTGGGGDPLSYFFQYALAAAAVSIPATLVFVNLGVGGLVLGCLALAPVATVFDAATMAFVRDTVAATGPAGRATAPDDGPTPAGTRVD
jgi:hypothetical protein